MYLKLDPGTCPNVAVHTDKMLRPRLQHYQQQIYHILRTAATAPVLYVLLALCLASSAPVLAASGFAKYHHTFYHHTRALLDNPSCLSCAGLATCLTVYCSSADFNTQTQIVTIDLSACKNGTFSWVCCRSSDCVRAGCTPTFDPSWSFGSCQDTTTTSYSIPLNLTELPLQVILETR